MKPAWQGPGQLATAAQLKALIKSYTLGDDSRFLSVATQIAAHAARAGKGRLAEDLRKLVADAKQARSGAPSRTAVPIAQPTGDLAGLVAASYPKTRLGDMVLADPIRRRLERVVVEDRQASLLLSHGLAPRRKLLLIGPPGCGKSMTAAAIAGELGRPLLSVQFHVLITKFMGETAAKLHQVFDSMQSARGVYLFDESVEIGAHRGAGNDVGEMRRVLNSFLLFLEQDRSDSIVIAATNLVAAMDEALFRRFDDVILYDPPTGKMTHDLVCNRLVMFEIRHLVWNRVLEAAAGHSHAEVVRACEDAAKQAVLAERKTIRTDDLIGAFHTRDTRNL